MRPYYLCRYCSRRTWSDKPEKDPALRYCTYHSPAKIAQRRAFTEANTRKTPLKPRKAQRNPFFLPLVCVFRPFEIIRKGIHNHRSEEKRVVRVTTDICGVHAPRKRSDRSLPKYPNRFGEPLCEAHRSFARDKNAFPDEPGALEIPLEEQAVDKYTDLYTRLNAMSAPPRS